MERPLCVLLPEIGVLTETFLRWDVQELLPGRTVIVCDPPPLGQSVIVGQSWNSGDAPTLTFEPLAGDPQPSNNRKDSVSRFLSHHSVEVVLVEYLDFAERWVGFLHSLNVRIWIRGHGIDLSARLQQPFWRDKYRSYSAVDGIMVPSRAAAARLRDLGLPDGQIHVVPYCSSTLRGSVAPRQESSTTRAIAVGRLVPKKGPLKTLEAFLLARRDNDGLTLDLVGDGPLMAEVRHFVREHSLEPFVTIHGSLPHEQTMDLVRSSDVLLHHAITAPGDGDAEGLPLAVLEAMGAGKPVVATAHEGIAEVISDGETGRLVGEGDVAQMALILLELATDPASGRRLGRKARLWATDHHGSGHCRKVILGLLGLT
jgi:colanic acid/amylovoran biosynthesis glycosyltransferase